MFSIDRFFEALRDATCPLSIDAAHPLPNAQTAEGTYIPKD